jgi:radical SAM protein with 4Fe4S-binding SPASM domain
MKLTSALEYPRWMVLQLNEVCNLRCRMCYEWGDAGSYHEKPTLASLEFEVIEQVLKDVLPGKPYFEFFGGEPLLYERFPDVIRLIKQGGSSLEIPTNGTLIAKYAEELVETKPDRIWVSCDGPEEINDKQRGKGVYKRIMAGIDRLYAVREAAGSELPKIGISYTVTPFNYAYIERFFLESLDLSKIDNIILTYQLYITEENYRKHAQILSAKFDVPAAPGAKGMVADPEEFAEMDFEELRRQLVSVRDACEERGIYFILYPKTIDLDNMRNYFVGDREQMIDRRSRCAFPWTYAEINARGDVTVCHTFYDLTVGNVYKEPILDIWNGARLQQVRDHLRKELFPICDACCRYYYDPNKR